MRVAEGLGRALARAGVKQFFAVVGSGNFAVTNALVASGVALGHARHECAAVSMADGYARVSGRVGVATVHQGPGLSNALTALAEAAKARTPLLALAAEPASADVRSNFRVDQEGLARSVGAESERIHTAESALLDLRRAWRLAASERRTVVLNLPLDIQNADCPDVPELEDDFRVESPGPSAQGMGKACDLLETAERPVIVAGRGAVVAGARDALEALGERTGALLATSANGNGLFAGSRWSIGISGGFATPLAARLLAEADVVLAFGASLNMWTTRHGELLGKRTKVVQVDADPAVIGLHHSVDLGIVADAAGAARELTTECDRRGLMKVGYRTEAVGKEIETSGWRDEPFEDASNGEVIDPRSLSIALDDLLPAERLVAVDSGHFMGWPAMYLSVPDAAGFVFTQAYQCVGLGLSSAIGAALARPDRLTVACLGDGGALMAAGEFETVVRLGLPLLVVVYNDSAYGAEVHHFGLQGQSVDIARFPDVDIAGLARGLGAEGVTVQRLGDLDALKSWLERRGRPLVLDAKIAPDVVAEWLEEAFRGH